MHEVNVRRRLRTVWTAGRTAPAMPRLSAARCQRYAPRATRSISSRTSRSTSMRQIVVQPVLQHRPQHLLGHLVEGLLAARGEGLGQLAEGGRDLRPAGSERIGRLRRRSRVAGSAMRQCGRRWSRLRLVGRRLDGSTAAWRPCSGDRRSRRPCRRAVGGSSAMRGCGGRCREQSTRRSARCPRRPAPAPRQA